MTFALGPSFTCLSSSYVGLLAAGVSGQALQFTYDYNVLTYPKTLQDMVGLYGWYTPVLVTPPAS